MFFIKLQNLPYKMRGCCCNNSLLKWITFCLSEFTYTSQYAMAVL